ncbi:hypothetical protein, partial [Salmonella sp. s51228]|uniref:hypothetical protein n=1 Tax=Salmonella sp. s51228 TaxID=3159652 RepID=UPI00397F2709
TYPVIASEDLIKAIDDSVSVQPFECQGAKVIISNVMVISDDIAEVSQFLVVLIVICCIICCIGTCLNGVAIHQRVIGLREKSRMDDYIYSEGMEGLDMLTTTHGMQQPEPFALVDDISFESQELKMDMFIDEIP